MRLAMILCLYPLCALASPAVAGSAKSMSPDELQSISAGEAPKVNVLTRQNLNALSTGNQITADAVTSGNVSFSDGAFSGFSGIGNVVVNTGNNNAIQGTLSVTVVGLQ